MKKYFVAFCCVLSITFFITCSTLNPNQEDYSLHEQKKPFQNFDIGLDDFQVNTDQDQTLVTKTGSTIQIPANCFVDEQQQPVEDVVIKYSEYHSPAEIITSGLSMWYDSAGVQYQFKTAGMFYISGFDKNGNAVYIKDGKELKVSMQSAKEGDFNIYKYNTEQATGWEYFGSAPQEQIKADEQKIDQLKESLVEPKEPMKFYADKDLVLDMEIDYSKFEELSKYNISIWKYVNTEDQNIANSRVWIKKELERHDADNSIYKLKLERNNFKEEILILPVLTGSDYTAALENYTVELEKYESLKEEIRKLEQNTQLVRSYPIKDFGYYNWDCIFKDPQKVWANTQFFIEGQESQITDFEVFHITNDQDVVVKYSRWNIDKFSYNPSSYNSLVVILSNGELYGYSNEEFSKIGLKPSAKSQDVKFVLMKSPEHIQSVDDLNNFIAQL